ncbi:MAG: hypothetical protein ACYDAY_03550 [Candidatus Dormibacteria bacterium]
MPGGDRGVELSVVDAAQALGVSVDTVRRRLRDGTLRARKEANGRLMVHLRARDAVEPGSLKAAQQRLFDEITRDRDRLAREVASLAEQLHASLAAQHQLRAMLARELERSIVLQERLLGPKPNLTALPREDRDTG